MASLCFISFVILAFKVTTDKPEANVNISYGADSIFVNDVVHFSSGNKDKKKFFWDFGDGTPLEQSTLSVNHIFKKAKTYTVKILEDENCLDIQSITIFEKKKVFTTSPEIVFDVNPTAKVNEKIVFADRTIGALSWEWKLEGSTTSIARTQNFTYSFKSPGLKKYELTVNKGKHSELSSLGYINIQLKEDEPEGIDNKNKGRHVDINKIPVHPPFVVQKDSPVIPIPEPAKPEPVKPKKGVDLSINQLESYLYDVSEGKKNAEEFGIYFCDNINIPVYYNDRQYTFVDFCAELKRLRKKIKKITPYAEKNSNNCINRLTVSIKKKFLSF